MNMPREYLPSLPKPLKLLIPLGARRQVGRRFALSRRRHIGRRGERRFAELFPEFRYSPKVRREWFARLTPAYKDYVESISSENWAVSLEQASFLAAYCAYTNPTRIVDLGSGFSSYVLRDYKERASQNVELTSVDDDPEWLKKTTDFLSSKGFEDSNVEVWTAFSEKDHEPFDLIFFDIASTDLRLSIFDQVINLCKPGGLVLVDDCHSPTIRERVFNYCASHECENLSLYNWLVDKFGRYGLALIPAEK